RGIDGSGNPNAGEGESVGVAEEETVFVGGALAVPLPRVMGLATADTRMKMTTKRRKEVLATKTAREREVLAADEGLREGLDMSASFLPYTNRHSYVWPWYTISDTIIQTRQSRHAPGYAGRVYAHTDNLPGESRQVNSTCH